MIAQSRLLLLGLLYVSSAQFPNRVPCADLGQYVRIIFFCFRLFCLPKILYKITFLLRHIQIVSASETRIQVFSLELLVKRNFYFDMFSTFSVDCIRTAVQITVWHIRTDAYDRQKNRININQMKWIQQHNRLFWIASKS